MTPDRIARIELYRRMLDHGRRASNEVGTPPPCDEGAIEALRRESREKLGAEVPEEFLDFLRVTDGAGFGNAGFKRAEHLVPDNLDVPMPEAILLGMEGNVNDIVFDKRDRRYHTTRLGSVDERLESFDTFAELLADLMRRQLRLPHAPAAHQGPAVTPDRNSRIEAYRRLLEQGREVSSEVCSPPPCGEDEIEALRRESREKLGEEVPEEFLDFLRVTGYAGIGNGGFKRAEHLVLENLDVPRPEVIVLGSEGNVCEYVFDRRDRRFHCINMGFIDERFESFDTFAELLADIMRRQLRMSPRLPEVPAKATAAARRAAFDGTDRAAFLKGLANDPGKVAALKTAGLTDELIAGMRNGELPRSAGYRVHHKIPVAGGGTNLPDNLVVIQEDPYHLTIINYQISATGRMAAGDTARLPWPMVPGFIYPP